MSEITSSGKKLYSLLKEAWDEDESNHTQKKVWAKNIWAKVLGADASSNTDISAKLGQLIVLLNDVKNDIQSLEIPNKDKFLKALDKIQVLILSKNMLDDEWFSIKGKITEETLDLIDACGDLLAAKSNKLIEVLPHDLEKLQQEIRKLQDNIRDSAIDKESKIFLINELRKIEDSIICYRIRGSSGLSKASEEVSGGILMKYSNMSKKVCDEALKVINIAIKTNSMVSVGERISKLPESLKELLPLLPPGN
ncbi:hypothetical protein [Aulosira sp. FACHB-615]|uniref:hypothetical protein n=1 Tax=Aulosira sp. FACHB-615 TaxID=2692777 RepID=UPI00168222C5|nr:hypothetical protein [Aulosira sp. FACHB-615]MBD2487044.1 hypothetical protein [Aulosira sp. FACHB-615]